MESSEAHARLRARLDQDLTAGRTIVLSQQELQDPTVRRELPGLLDELARNHRRTATGPDIPGYRLLGEIGQGGMSTVYLARHERLGRHVAVKIAPKWLGGGDRARRMLAQEARAMAKLQHPNVVAIYDILDFDDSFAIAMEWVDGCTLADLLRALPDRPRPDDVAAVAAALDAPEHARAGFEPSPERLFAAMIRDVALAAQAVHDNDLLHLDIKPSNVLVRRDGTPLLADFGVTRSTANDDERTRTFAGTPTYAAPEQLRRDDRRIGPTADVYGLGLTLYEALARRQPLREEAPATIVDRVERGRVPRLSERFEVPPDLENVVHKAIMPEPERRYPSARALADDLQAFLDGRPVTARPLGRAQRLRRWVRTEPWRAGLAATLLVLLPLIAGVAAFVADDAAARRASADRAAAADLREHAWFGWFTAQLTDDESLRQLRRAAELDPTDASLGALLTFHAELGAAYPAAERARDRGRLAASPTLRLCLAKGDEGRTFFADDEVERLQASDDPTALYVLALDRMLWADDADHEAANRDAAAISARASRLWPEDPLLALVHAWTLLRAGQADEGAAVLKAIEQRWSRDADTLAWAALVAEPTDPARTEELARRAIAVAPASARGYEVLANCYRRTERAERIPDVLAEATAAGADTRAIRRAQQLAAVSAGDRDAAEALLAGDAGPLRPIERARALQLLDPSRARAFVDDLLGRERLPPRLLSDLYSHGAKTDSPELQDRCWELYRRWYRDRRRLHVRQFVRFYFEQEDYAGAAELAREITARNAYVDQQAPALIRAALTERDWADARRHAEHWLEHGGGEQRQEAAFYVAMCASRLGDFSVAAEKLAVALYGSVQVRQWYASGLLEDAWLRATEEAPAALRDLALAKVRLEQFERLKDRLKRVRTGPWTDCVRATVRYADGDLEGARAAVESGLAPQKREPHAPRDYRERLLRLRERLEGR